MALAVPFAAAARSAHARLLSPARGQQTSLEGVAGVQKLVLDRATLAALRARDSAVVRDFPLGRTRAADLVLARFEPFAPGARVEIVEPGGARALTLPDRVYFRGTVAGEDDSHVLLIAARARVHGFVVSRGEVFPFGPDGRGGHRSYALRDADPTRYPPPGDFCANDLAPEAVRIPPAARALAATPPVASTAGTLKQANVAIDTDQELRAKFPSDSAALDYLASLAAAATSIYERDVAVRLRFSYIRLWGAAPPDPWSATAPGGALGEVRTYWNDPANKMDTTAGPRTVVHFVSGKSVQGGVAYIDVLCNASYGYGVSQVYGSFDLSQPSQIWDALVVTHELGHNFGTPHTHCYSPPLDKCYANEAGCYSGPVVASRGTVMSYCHLLAGGLSNIDLVFGDVVSARIGQSVGAASCLATVPASTTTTTTTTTIPISTTTSTTAKPPTTTSTTLTTSTTTTARPTTTTSPSTSSTTTSTSTTSTIGTSSTATTASTSSSTSTTVASVSSSTVTTTPSTTTTSTTTVAPSTSTTLPAVPGGDSDGDGVPDARDACAGTPPGDVVDASGCSLCPCDGPRGGGRWQSRSAYLRCVRGQAKLRVALGVLGRHERRSALERARQSSCGRAAATRCCLYTGANDVTGRCRVMRGAACATHVSTGAAADLGPGSCMPSPCAR